MKRRVDRLGVRRLDPSAFRGGAIGQLDRLHSSRLRRVAEIFSVCRSFSPLDAGSAGDRRRLHCQAGVPAEEFSRYDSEWRIIKYHRAQIRAVLGFREPTVQDADELAAWAILMSMSMRRPINAYVILGSSRRHRIG